MKTRILVLAVIIFTGFITVKSFSQVNDSIAPQDSICFLGIHFENAFTGWAVTGCGSILKTTDCGKDWKIQHKTRSKKVFLSVCFYDLNTGWISGRNGLIMKTINGGKDWITQHTGTKNDIYSIVFMDTKTGFAVGDKGLIMKSTNGGELWERNKIKFPEFFVSAFFLNENTGWISGGRYEKEEYIGVIYRTENSGSDWEKIYENKGGFINSICMTSVNKGMAVCDSGRVIVFKEGLTCNVINIESASDLYAVYYSNPAKVFVAGCQGQIYSSEDDGATWTQIETGTNKTFYAVHVPVKNITYISGEKGVFIKK